MFLQVFKPLIILIHRNIIYSNSFKPFVTNWCFVLSQCPKGQRQPYKCLNIWKFFLGKHSEMHQMNYKIFALKVSKHTTGPFTEIQNTGV